MYISAHVGHFGNGTGASSLVDEVKESRRIAQHVKAILDLHKVPNKLYEDTVSKSQKDNVNHLISYHNKENGALIVSYHLNASGGVTNVGIGTEVCYKSQGLLAKKLSDAIAAAGEFKNRGAKYRDNIGVLARTKNPSVLLETFFVNSNEDVELYNKNFDKICFAIAKVLAEYIGYKIEEGVEEKVEFTSTSLKASYDNRQSSPATHKLIDDAAFKHLGYTSKLKNGKLSEGDLNATALELAVHFAKLNK